MRRLPLLTAAAIVAALTLVTPGEARADCDNCTDMNGKAMCKSEPGGEFGACVVKSEYDECGNETNTYCSVQYASYCSGGGGFGWEGWMTHEDYLCFMYGCGWGSSGGGGFWY